PPADSLLRLLRKRFKHKNFRASQLEAITATLGGKDVFVRSETGAGKSLDYQLPAVKLAEAGKGPTVVISPTKALIEDQASELDALGILNFILSRGVSRAASYRNEVIIFLTPEKLIENETTQYFLKKVGVARFVIDEAHYGLHCHEGFRPAFKRLSFLREHFPSTPIMAMSASISERDCSELIAKWGLRDPVMIRPQTFNRSNISYEFELMDGKASRLERTLKFVEEYEGAGIIYAATPALCKEIAETLMRPPRHGKVGVHHSELKPEERKKLMDKWNTGGYDIVVATPSSFGLGINRLDVRWVLHYSPPQSLAHYYQESGRCGRAGQPAVSFILYSHDEANLVHKIISHPKYPRATEDFRELKRLFLDQKHCVRTTILAEFGETFDPGRCLDCYSCVRVARKETDTTSIAKDAIRLVAAAGQDKRITVSQAIHCLRGTLYDLGPDKRLDLQNLPTSTQGPRLAKQDLEMLFAKLILDDYLIERKAETHWAYLYLDVGLRGEALLMGEGFSYFMELRSPLGKERAPRTGENVVAKHTHSALFKRCFDKLKELPSKGIDDLVLRRIARSLPLDGDELFETKILTPNAKLEPVLSWYFKSGAQDVCLEFEKKKKKEMKREKKSTSHVPQIVYLQLSSVLKDFDYRNETYDEEQSFLNPLKSSSSL
ncbi:hypothetical protein P7C70_g4051, partial [Phenoliferia sp. Uapishka_3]